MAISTGVFPKIRGVEIDNDIRRMQYHVRLDYRAIEAFPGDPWIAIMDEAIRKYHGELKKESLCKLSMEELETLARMIIHEMDLRGME